MTDAVNVFPPGFRVLDANGAPVSGAIITFFDAGTSTARTVYLDDELTTSLGSTVYCDAGGHPVAGSGSTTKVLVWISTADYKIVIKTSAGVTLATFDNVKGAVVSGSGGGGSSGITQSAADLRYIRNPNALTAVTGLDATDILPLWDTATSSNRGIAWSNLKTDLVSELRSGGVVFSAADRLLSQQATAPIGWTRVTTYINHALRLTAAAPGTGGSVAFTTAFASQTPSISIGNTTLTEAQIATHDHNTAVTTFGVTAGAAANLADNSGSGKNYGSDTAGSSNSHTHSGSSSAIDLAVQYVDVNIITKDA